MPDEAGLRQEMVRVGRLLYERQLIVAAEGNLSARLGGGLFLVTPAGSCKGFLAAADLLVVDERGRPPAAGGARPSSEWLLHRVIYAARPEVAAVCHAHPPWATAFATARQPLDGCVLPEIVATLGAVPLADYATPGTAEVPRSVRALLDGGHAALLLANHGVVALAPTLTEAYHRLESVERLAQVTLLARLAGREARLGETQVRAILAGHPDAAAPPACEPAPPGRAGDPGASGLAGGSHAALDALATAMAAAILAELRRGR